MLSQNHFYYNMFRKYIVAFKHIFSDIHILRTDNGIVKKDITVPVTYASKSKLFYQLQRDEDVARNISSILPRISFIINAMQFDATRKKSNLNEISVTIDEENESFIYSGNPYNFNVDMSIWSIYMGDLLQIIEQVTSFFRPDFVVTVNEIPELSLTRKIPVVLNNVNLDVDNEFDVDDRIVKADLNFTIKGYIYPPISDGKVIRHIKMKFGTLPSENVDESVLVDWDEINEKAITTIIDGDWEE